MEEAQVPSLSWRDPLEEKMATTLVFLPVKSHGQKRLAGYSPWGSQRELDMQKLNDNSNVIQGPESKK